MAEKDIVEKTLEAYNDVFADIVNVLLLMEKNTFRRKIWRMHFHVLIIRRRENCGN